MLEFQESFFDQEIRNGFYIDSTMKTAWAAELEVLQRIAEICDKYGLTWFAAYGTLLGAIRHEGFVPWDDDMDIWLLRKDYNILMKVLQKELPEGYRVRSPLADEAYNQFHTGVINGSGISIAPEWLEQFHGCPFTVGVDIFPLDYLPRNEQDRVMQEKVFGLVAHVAQLARNMNDGEYDKKEGECEETVKRRKQGIKNEIKEGISYLEKKCKLPICRQLLYEEKWYALSSEMWKWANHVAMIYGEKESDYLVEYLDYANYSQKIYPKEWFGEVYGATFENVMLPIPCGYDQILHTIYKNYHYMVKKVGQHEYPFYARQLKDLREYVKKMERQAEQTDGAAIEEKEDTTMNIREEWCSVIRKEDGSSKKIILSANNPHVYASKGDRALDKLENTLKQFEESQDTIALWWRPQPIMKKVLDQVSAALGERYQSILDTYKKAGWGICDETDNIDRAVELCDAYYGEMNAILQPFQNTGKPIMISELERVE